MATSYPKAIGIFALCVLNAGIPHPRLNSMRERMYPYTRFIWLSEPAQPLVYLAAFGSPYYYGKLFKSKAGYALGENVAKPPIPADYFKIGHTARAYTCNACRRRHDSSGAANRRPDISSDLISAGFRSHCQGPARGQQTVSADGHPHDCYWRGVGTLPAMLIK